MPLTKAPTTSNLNAIKAINSNLMRRIAARIFGRRRKEIFRVPRMLSVLAILLFARTAISQATQFSGWFVISGLTVSSAGNMTLRVNGMPTVSACTAAGTWAYVDENDSGSREKIAALLTAYSSGKSVNLQVTATNFYNDGQMFCHVIDFSVSG
jgi:hypothetical protein